GASVTEWGAEDHVLRHAAKELRRQFGQGLRIGMPGGTKAFQGIGSTGEVHHGLTSSGSPMGFGDIWNGDANQDVIPGKLTLEFLESDPRALDRSRLPKPFCTIEPFQAELKTLGVMRELLFDPASRDNHIHKGGIRSVESQAFAQE